MQDERRVVTATAALLAAAVVLAATATATAAQEASIVSVEEACRNAASTHEEQYCVSSLALDSRSRDAATAAQEASIVSLEEACRNAASTHEEEQYCVSSLASDARSRDAAADLRTLAALATRIAAEHAASTGARMEDLSEVEESPRARARLHHCLDMYSAAADALSDALDNIRSRVYGKASSQLAAALGASESCEDVWKGEERTPVAGHDREYGRMALVALGLTSGIVGSM